MQVIQEKFGEIDQQPIYSFNITNESGAQITCINYGCAITKIIIPDRDGCFENVVLGYDSLEKYIDDTAFLGAVIGRVGGRIKDGCFELDGKKYTLVQNERSNHLHGGIKGFNRVIWDAETFNHGETAGVQFKYFSKDGEEGYPGNVSIRVTYTFNNKNELVVSYEADTDKKTLLTLTNHSYFNLSGNLKKDILHHTLRLKSEKFLELDSEFIPTGTLLNVRNTSFDFTQERNIKSGTVSDHPQNILVGKGYDHPFVLDSSHDQEIVLKDPESGRTLIVETDEVGVIVYTGNGLPAEGDYYGIPSRKHMGICLETQGLPDAIHHPAFPQVTLDKGEKYKSVTKYQFDIES